MVECPVCQIKKIIGTDTSFRLQFTRPSGKSSFFANRLISYKENGYKISLQGEDIIEGKRCFVIQLELDKKSYDLYYINADTYRVIMSQTRYLSGPDGDQIYYTDYRQVNGVWFHLQLKILEVASTHPQKHIPI